MCLAVCFHIGFIPLDLPQGSILLTADYGFAWTGRPCASAGGSFCLHPHYGLREERGNRLTYVEFYSACAQIMNWNGKSGQFQIKNDIFQQAIGGIMCGNY